MLKLGRPLFVIMLFVTPLAAQSIHSRVTAQGDGTALPGVTAASYSAAPLLAGSLSSTGFHKPGTPPTSRDEKDDVPSDELPVGPKFFSTLHIPLLTGRDFTAADFAIAEENSGEQAGSAPTPVIVNQVFAEQYFPGVNPVGQIFADTVPVKPEEKKMEGNPQAGAR